MFHFFLGGILQFLLAFFDRPLRFPDVLLVAIAAWRAVHNAIVTANVVFGVS